MEYKGFKNEFHSESINIYNGDCMELMRQTPDNYYDLALVDPPYGIDIANMNMGAGTGKRCSNIKNRKWIPKNWDSMTPDKEYFEQLFRVSKNQIIWGANYFVPFLTHGTKGWIVWYKGQEGLTMSDAELAYSSFNCATRVVKINRCELLKDGTFHPTQKPEKLYKWLLQNYANPTDTILDTHGGSFSSDIAAHDGHFKFTGVELDADYYEAAKKRIQYHQRQQNLF